GKPVPGFGAPSPKLWIVGLAPGAHGANRTGRVFTGDSSGNWLYSALYRHGYASSPTSLDAHDGLKLTDTFISCICRCAPPDNRPTSKEIFKCRPFLQSEWNLLKQPPLILALGQLAFEETLSLLSDFYLLKKSREWRFKHGAVYRIGKTDLLVSYHPSRQNTSTKRLTLQMWDGIFDKTRELLENHSL
ncbi:uracil-DNA glycosylase, partial [bacterium]|nr:uracil-DNA glycosylase [bacterium]